MSDLTHILSAIEEGDPKAAAQLLPLVYDELRKLAARQLAQVAGMSYSRLTPIAAYTAESASREILLRFSMAYGTGMRVGDETVNAPR